VPKISARTLEQHRTETLDRLLDAWAELVKSKGYTEVSLADVAGQAGLARTAIYNYFPDREALLFAWTDREVRRTLAILEREVAETDSCTEKLRIFVRMQLVDFANRHLPPGQEVVQFLRPETYGRFMEHIEPVERTLREILTEGVESGDFARHDPATTVPLVMACIGAERAPLASRAHDVEEATERVTGFLLRALGGVEAAAAAPKKPRASKPKAAPKKTAAAARKRAR
jgi:AcrR family transcriptional regulator